LARISISFSVGRFESPGVGDTLIILQYCAIIFLAWLPVGQVLAGWEGEKSCGFINSTRGLQRPPKREIDLALPDMGGCFGNRRTCGPKL
jgi:hypothetical protein